MSLSMSAFSTKSKWKVTAGRSQGGRREGWNGNCVTAGPSLQLTCNQTEAQLAVIKH